MNAADPFFIFSAIKYNQCLFKGFVFKQSDFLKLWNIRYVAILKSDQVGAICAYWLDGNVISRVESGVGDSGVESLPVPRGIFSLEDASFSADIQTLEIEISNLTELLNSRLCFEFRLKNSSMKIRTESIEEFVALRSILSQISERRNSSEALTTLYTPINSTVNANQDLLFNIENDKLVALTQPQLCLSDFDIVGELGKGAFSSVYRATRKETGEDVAVKTVKLTNTVKIEANLKYLNHEISVMRKLERNNDSSKVIVKLLLFFPDNDSSSANMVFQLCTGGELFDRIVERSNFSEKDAKKVVKTLAGAISAIHAAGVVHRDIKPENLIYSVPGPAGVLKIADFGLALDLDNADKDVYKSRVVGTLGYFAPEALYLRYGPACDMWSLGVVIYILLCGYPPFYAEKRFEVQNKIRKADFTFFEPEWTNISANAKDLICKLLQVDPRRRLSPSQVLEHNWLAQSRVDEESDAISLDMHRKWNRKRKLKGAAIAVISASRFRNLINEKDFLVPIDEKDFETFQKKFQMYASEPHVNEIKDELQKKQGTKRGVRSPEQLRKVLVDIGYKGLNIERIFQVFDENQDGCVDEREFLAGLAALHTRGEPFLRFAFSLYDTNGSGSIDRDEFFSIMSLCPECQDMDAEDSSTLVSEIFDMVDKNSDSLISFEEFKIACEGDSRLYRMFLSTGMNSSED